MKERLAARLNEMRGHYISPDDILPLIAEEVRAIKNPKPLVPEDYNEWYHGFEDFRQKVLDLLK